MRLINFKFVKSASKPAEFITDELPQVAIVGRSNVGKSSLINMLANNKKMAKTSSTPGRTRLVNYFDIDGKVYLVDLPGYGFAQASKSIKKEWDRVLDDYFNNTHNLKLVLLLIDSRHLPSELDVMMINYLVELNIPYQIILTKADKLSRNELNKNINAISNHIRHNKSMFISTSADKKIGAEQIAKAIDNAINIETSSDN
ncbi:MAG: YihA family ribosome biogenesis GTP-binding protein [Clostridia bacterium]|nr:YihA family ribosome biogenesis GTP-binding protein [Clostridia bacterium]